MKLYTLLAASFLSLWVTKAAHSENIILKTDKFWQTEVSTDNNIFYIRNTDQNALIILSFGEHTLPSLAIILPSINTTKIQLRAGPFEIDLTKNTLPNGTPIYVNDIPPNNLRAFIHGLTSAKSGEVIADGKVIPVSFLGSSNAVNGVFPYAKEHSLTNLPEPFILADTGRAPSTKNYVSNSSINEKPSSQLTSNSTNNNKEEQFIAIIDKYSSMYDAGANEMAKGAARPARAKAICTLMEGPLLVTGLALSLKLAQLTPAKGFFISAFPLMLILRQ